MRLNLNSLFCFVLVTFGLTFSYGQTGLADQTDTTVYDYAQKPASYPWGVDSLFNFIYFHLQRPEYIDVQASVYVQFIIEADGSISTIEVIKSVHEDLDKEAVRVIKLISKWNPAEHDGNFVRSRYTIPIRFYLE